MTVKLEAPYPSIATTTYLPSPTLGDSESVLGALVTKRKMSGSVTTYVLGSGDRRSLLLGFRLSRQKALELRAFIERYFAEKVRLTDHEGTVWIGNFVINPFEFESVARANNYPGGTLQAITVEFQGERQ